jgi:1-acyl-sn-glycerol-3-phosphate acyltransferase
MIFSKTDENSQKGYDVRGENEAFWLPAVDVICAAFNLWGWLLHGHELVGAENIPREGKALIIYYHGICPVDFYFAYSRVLLATGRYIKPIADRFLFKITGFGTMLRAIDATTGSIDSCIDKLNQGHMLLISPGGTKEGYNSGHAYHVVWGKRCGFAKIAQGAHCPIIPMLTTNSQEVLSKFPLLYSLFFPLYKHYNFPLLPMFGYWPVKMITVAGRPIEYEPSRTPEQLRDLVNIINKSIFVLGLVYRKSKQNNLKPKQKSWKSSSKVGFAKQVKFVMLSTLKIIKTVVCFGSKVNRKFVSIFGFFFGFPVFP